MENFFQFYFFSAKKEFLIFCHSRCNRVTPKSRLEVPEIPYPAHSDDIIPSSSSPFFFFFCDDLLSNEFYFFFEPFLTSPSISRGIRFCLYLIQLLFLVKLKNMFVCARAIQLAWTSES